MSVWRQFWAGLWEKRSSEEEEDCVFGVMEVVSMFQSCGSGSQ